MSKGKARAIVATVGITMVLGVTLLVNNRGRSEVTTGIQPADPQLVSPLVDELPRPPVKFTPKKAAAESQRARVMDTDSSTKDWAVVTAIYNDYDAAARQARNVTDSSYFDASVFPSRGEGAKYMVIIGKGFTRTRAEEVRQKALAAGLPGDTYVTRLGVNPAAAPQADSRVSPATPESRTPQEPPR